MFKYTMIFFFILAGFEIKEVVLFVNKFESTLRWRINQTIKKRNNTLMICAGRSSCGKFCFMMLHKRSTTAPQLVL